MKREVAGILLLGVLLTLPLVLAQEQSQVYSGFDRFIDNVKMFFSSGDAKVMLALEIREKELNSAIANTNNGENEKATKNLERARERLQYVQNKVSDDIAEDVKTNVEEIISKVEGEENLTDDFDVYLLEEEKTGLVAELVIEVEGKEGQTLTRSIVKDNETNKKKVEISIGEGEGKDVVESDNASNGANNVIEGEATEGKLEIVVSDEESKTEELEKRIGEIDEEIVKWVIKNVLTIDNEVSKTKGNGGVTSSGGNSVDDDVAPGPQGIVGDQGYSDDEGHTGDVPDDTSGASGEIDED